MKFTSLCPRKKRVGFIRPYCSSQSPKLFLFITGAMLLLVDVELCTIQLKRCYISTRLEEAYFH